MLHYILDTSLKFSGFLVFVVSQIRNQSMHGSMDDGYVFQTFSVYFPLIQEVIQDKRLF
jgi:hypothetical protein